MNRNTRSAQADFLPVYLHGGFNGYFENANVQEDWHGCKDSNPDRTVLETGILPLNYTRKLAPAERIELPLSEVHNLPLSH
jgi:hypothetical protein